MLEVFGVLRLQEGQCAGERRDAVATAREAVVDATILELRKARPEEGGFFCVQLYNECSSRREEALERFKQICSR